MAATLHFRRPRLVDSDGVPSALPIDTPRVAQAERRAAIERRRERMRRRVARPL